MQRAMILRGIQMNLTGNPMSAVANSVGVGEMPINSKLDFWMLFIKSAKFFKILGDVDWV